MRRQLQGYGGAFDLAAVQNDRDQLRRFAYDGDQAAFADLVGRHVDLVYGAALRQVRSPEMAEEVTQAVFILLSGKAATLGRDVIVAAWLHRAAFYTARNLVRREGRRRRHERRAAAPGTAADPWSPAPTWERLAPALDAGVASLREADRQAIVLRFFRRHTLADVGRAMGISEDAAQMRVSRAVAKLRDFFARQGVTLDACSLANVVWVNAAGGAGRGAPPHLTAAVLRGARGAGGPAAGMAGVTAGAMARAMAWARVRLVSAAVAAMVVGVGGTTFVVQRIVLHGPAAASRPEVNRE